LIEGVSATSVDAEGKKVSFSDKSTVEYENLVLATGGAAKRLPLPGAKEGELENVFTLRGVGDTSAIVAACGESADKDVVVVGTSFIGMEVAIALAGQKKAKSVTVIGMEDVPFQNVLGKEVGAGLMEAQKKANGLKFFVKAGVEKLEGSNGKVSAVVIKDESGSKVDVPAQVVILGVGVSPATGYLKESPGFPALEKDGSIAVDKDLRVKGLTKDSNVFACGDIATVPARDEAGANVRIEHWNVAGNHGRAVGKLIAGEKGEPFDKLPIFWSALGSQLRYVSDGNPPGFDDVYIDGKVQDLKFAAYYAKKGKVNAVATMGIDPLVMHSSILLVNGKMPSLDEIKGGTDPLSVSLA
jgi:NADPH-dependent 2,4-dienoyl-CoA reductase/sulfur reductase-like enzyme